MPGNWKKKTFVPVDHFPDFNLESSTIIIKNMFIMKNLTDFRKTVETGVDPRLRGGRGGLRYCGIGLFFMRYFGNLRICSCLACVYRVMDARGKFGEHERCVRVARGDSDFSNGNFAFKCC